MTNKEKFINTFGKTSYEKIVNAVKGTDSVVEILEWFLEDSKESLFPEYKYEGPGFEEVNLVADEIAVKATNAIKAIDEEMVEKSKKGGSRPGRGFDLNWYITVVEDFYLRNDKQLELKMSDDKSSGKKVTSLDGYKERFKTAVQCLNLQDDVEVHKYYANTTNECICLSKPMEFNGKFRDSTVRR